ncbi:MAG: hypothetical protein EBS32_07735, partial [Actinobacteria bacterium]|nr:hypothetical protein [Actinomycetota bacterium]
MAEFSLHLTDDQLQIKDWIHEFAKDVMRPAAQEWDDREEFPWPVVQEAAKIGLYGIEFMMNAMTDSSGLTLPVAIEEIFWGDAGLGMAIMGSGLAAAGISGNGTPEQVMEWVPQCYGTADDIKLGAFCVSEPDAGSDVSSLRTRAVYDEATDEWVLNGTKAWITNGGIADVHVVVAAVDPALKGRGQASFIVPPKTKGLSQGQKYKKHGIKASHTAEVVLDDVRIPGRCLLGGKEKLDAKLARAREAGRTGEGQPAMKTFEATRPAVGAQALGIARAAYEIALDYAKERVAFGKPIIMNQAIAFKLANMATQIDAEDVEKALEFGELRQPDARTRAERVQQHQRGRVIAARHFVVQDARGPLQFRHLDTVRQSALYLSWQALQLPPVAPNAGLMVSRSLLRAAVTSAAVFAC